MALVITFGLLSLHGCGDNVGGEASLLRQDVGGEASLLCQNVGGEASSFAKTGQPTTALMVEDYSCQSSAKTATIKTAELRRPDMKVRVRRGDRLVLRTEGLRLTAEDSAVARWGQYSVTALHAEELPPMPEGMVNVTLVGNGLQRSEGLATAMQRSEAGGFRLLPSGRNFSPYAELRVAYDEARLPFGYTPDDIYTSYYDEATRQWVRLQRVAVDTASHEIVSLTDHFTDFVNEVLKAPEMPETQAFVPTAMSNIATANPLAGYTLISPPEPNNMGTASLSYPFNIPAARGAFQPTVSLSYSSSAGNGECGYGWSLNIPEVSVDTRWGVPLYDDDYESETYLYEGEQLTTSREELPAFAHPFDPRQPGDVRFYSRVEEDFDSIVRHGTSPADYSWEVFSRDGVRLVFGGDGDAVLRSQRKGGIARWHLKKAVDINGNTVIYSYRQYCSAGAGSVSGSHVYPAKITYTAPRGGKAHGPWHGYCVTFHYGGPRPDPVIDGRHGVKDNMALRLDSVKTWYVRHTVEGGVTLDELNALSASDSIINRHLKDYYDRQTSVDDLLDWAATYLGRPFRSVQTDSILIRGYRLLYTCSATGKSLLSAIVEMSPSEWASVATTVSPQSLSANSTLKYHKFSYKGIGQATFGPEEVYGAVNDDADELFKMMLSPLGGSAEFSETISGSAGAGLGCDPTKRTLNVEAEGDYTIHAKTDGHSALEDLNGDGFPDALFKRFGQWRYQLYNPQSKAFGPVRTMELPGGFSSSRTSDDYSLGGSLHAGFELEETNLGVNLGVRYDHSASDNSIYMTDVNSDGRTDIVSNGTVWFNNTHDDVVSFGTTPSDLQDLSMPCETSHYSLAGASPMDADIFAEGHASQTFVSGFEEVEGSVAVAQHPVATVLAPSSRDTVRRSVVRVWVAPRTGDVSITGFAKLDDRFSEARQRTAADGVHVSVQHNMDLLPECCHDLTPGQPAANIVSAIHVEQGDRVYFRVEALNDNRYDVVYWNPQLQYLNENASEHDCAGRLVNLFSAERDFLAWGKDYFDIPSDGSVHIDASYSLSRQACRPVKLAIVCSDTTGTVTYWSKERVIAAGSTVTSSPFILDTTLNTGQLLHFEVEENPEADWAGFSWHPHIIATHFSDTTIPSSFVTFDKNGDTVTVNSVDVRLSPLFKGISAPECPSPIDCDMFGGLYRGWGCFAYNSDTVRTAIQESLLHESEALSYENVEGIVGGAAALAQETTNPDSVAAGLSTMLPIAGAKRVERLQAVWDGDGERRVYSSVANRAFVTPTLMGLMGMEEMKAILGDDGLLYPTTNSSIAASGGTAVGPVKTMEQESSGAYCSLSLSPSQAVDTVAGLTSTFSYSKGASTAFVDFFDLNGDGYPDVVGSNAAQYSSPHGGLTDVEAGIAPTASVGVRKSSFNTRTGQAGVTYARYRTIAGGLPSVFAVQSKRGRSMGGGITLAASHGNGTLDWIDINGDGLPDRVDGNDVALNLGYDFYIAESVDELWAHSNKSVNTALSTSADFSHLTEVSVPVENTSVRTVNGSATLGNAVSLSRNEETVTFADIDGDGMADKVIDDKVWFNTGWGFHETSSPSGIQHLPSSFSANFTSNGSLTVGVPIEVFGMCFKAQVNAGSSTTAAVHMNGHELRDMNADGLPDLVSHSLRTVKVRHNLMFDVDRLTTVESFYGNRIVIEYAQAEWSARSDRRPTVMSALTVSDVTGGSYDVRHFAFLYGGYTFSKAERQSYGFSSVKVMQFLGDDLLRSVVSTYRTDSYAMRGKLASVLTEDASGHPFIARRYVFAMKRVADGGIVPPAEADCQGASWPAVDSVLTIHYDGASAAARITVAERHIHGSEGRLACRQLLNNIATPADDICLHITYSRRPHNLSALPRFVFVTRYGGSTILRRNIAAYDSLGNMVSFTRDAFSNAASPTTHYAYDSFGNIVSATLPPDADGGVNTTLFSYDTLVHTYCTSSTDSVFGDCSRSVFDVRLGVPTKHYSVGGDSISITYDEWARPAVVRLPGESDVSRHPTLRFLYWDDPAPASQQPVGALHVTTGGIVQTGTLPASPCHGYSGGPLWAAALHRSQDDNRLALNTVTFTDGHSRILQSRSTAVVRGVTTQVASGHIIYDDAGRENRIYEPFTTGLPLCQYATPPDTGLFRAYTYDVLDRTTLSSIPSENINISTEYGFAPVSSVPQFLSMTTDANGNISRVAVDVRGLTLAENRDGGAVTSFSYDCLGQLLSYTDPDGLSTTYAYDNLGRMTRRLHPDAGITSFSYGPDGQVASSSGPGGTLTCSYDHGRLVGKHFSSFIENNVSYTYGTAGRDRGKVVAVQDGSGRQTLEYDALGNVSHSVRTLSVPRARYAYAFSHSFIYDSHGRLLQLTYPDGERVDYGYNAAGSLATMSGTKRFNIRHYINGITYNIHGQRTAVSYGNGAQNTYSYNRLHRLDSLVSVDRGGHAMQRLSYNYDPVGNITSIHNSASPVGTLGGSYSTTYSYDALCRLRSASSSGTVGTFNTSMSFTPSGRPARKTRATATAAGTESADFMYGYSLGAHSHFPEALCDNAHGVTYMLSRDGAGNLAQMDLFDNTAGHRGSRMLFWNDAGNLYTVADDAQFSYYVYDHEGHRTLKLTGSASQLDNNADRMHIHAALDDVTLYPSPYIVVTPHGYTKHYYAAGERIAARIGSGGLSHDTTCIMTDQTVTDLYNDLFDRCHKVSNERRNSGEPPSDITDVDGNPLPGIDRINFSDAPGALLSELEVYPFRFEDCMAAIAPEGGRPWDEPNVYFCHSDHLGSASWITNSHGMPVQHLRYLPYGEPYINQRTSGYSERFTFTGKERDPETGFSYFGARYYDPDLSALWLSVDPMADKYPGISPYAYCAWNPVRLVDPDGKDTFNIDLKTGYLLSSTVELKGLHCFVFYIDDEIVGICGDLSGLITFSSVLWEDGNNDNVTDYFSFTDGESGRKVFNTISSLAKDYDTRSPVEWDYYMLNDGSGDLSTSHLSSLMGHDEIKYNSNNVKSWDHYHPRNSDLSWFPSHSDQDNARSLQNGNYGNVPCYIHTCGTSYRFDKMVFNKNLNPYEIKKLISNSIIGSVW